MGRVEIDLDQLSDISGLKELQARLLQIREDPKREGAELQPGGKVSILGHGVDLGHISRAGFGSISKARQTFGKRDVRTARPYKTSERRKKEIRQPVVDILEERKNIKLIIDLPGVEDESQIHYDIEDRKFILVTSAFAGMRYRAEADLHHDLGELTSKSLRNGIFLLSFAKKPKR